MAIEDPKSVHADEPEKKYLVAFSGFVNQRHCYQYARICVDVDTPS